MRLSLAVLTKQAIEAALKQNWKLAIKLNLEILEQYPNDIDSKIRLGRAYIQTKNFTEAKKIFKEVLKDDPINPIALKNLELAKIGRSECVNIIPLSTKSLLKEPGTTHEIKLTLKAKGLTSDDFSSGEELIIRAKKRSVDLYKSKKNKNILVGFIDDNYAVTKINSVQDRKGKIQAVFTHGRDNEIWILLKASIPIFKPDKIDIRPYLKKGTIDEPEIDIESDSEEEIE